MKRCGKSAPASRATGMARQTPPEARSRRPHESAAAQAFEGCSPESAGRPLEAPGNGVSRRMVAAAPPLLKRGGGEQNPAYRPTRPPYVCDLVAAVLALLVLTPIGHAEPCASPSGNDCALDDFPVTATDEISNDASVDEFVPRSLTMTQRSRIRLVVGARR